MPGCPALNIPRICRHQLSSLLANLISFNLECEHFNGERQDLIKTPQFYRRDKIINSFDDLKANIIYKFGV